MIWRLIRLASWPLWGPLYSAVFGVCATLGALWQTLVLAWTGDP